MEGHLKKRGKYYSVVVYMGKDENGVKQYKWISTKCEKKPDAEKAKREILTSMDNGVFIEPSKKTFSEFILEWLESEIKGKREETTYEDYKSRIEKYIIPYFKDILLTKLLPTNIKKYYKYLQEEKKLSPNTVHHHHANIHKCLDYALSEELVVRNVSEAIPLPPKVKYKAKFYDGKQIEKLIKAIKETYVEVPVTITIAMGLRRGEVLGLKWDAVNLETGEMYIHTTRTRRKKIITKATKNEFSRRTLIMPEYLVKYLKLLQLKQEQNKKWKFGNTYSKENYICCKDDGSPLDVNYVNQVFTKVLEDKKLPHIRFHDLRHSNASYLLKQGVTMKELQEWLGHGSMATTSDIYSHIDAEQKKSIAKKSNNMFKNVK